MESICYLSNNIIDTLQISTHCKPQKLNPNITLHRKTMYLEVIDDMKVFHVFN